MREITSLDDLCLVSYGEPGVVNAEVEYTFKRTGYVYRGHPVIIGGSWTPRDAATMAECGVLAHFSVDYETVEELDLLFVGIGRGVMDRLVMTLDYAEDVQAFEHLSLGDHAPRFVRVSNDAGLVDELRATHPDVVVIDGTYMSYAHANQSEADLRVVGSPFEPGKLMEAFGIAIDVATLSRETLGPRAFQYACVTPGDVAKCFALGAQFVEIGPAMRGYSIEQLCHQLAQSCYFLGASCPYDLPDSCGLHRSR